jgi:hypothetical protein
MREFNSNSNSYFQIQSKIQNLDGRTKISKLITYVVLVLEKMPLDLFVLRLNSLTQIFISHRKFLNTQFSLNHQIAKQNCRKIYSTVKFIEQN